MVVAVVPQLVSAYEKSQLNRPRKNWGRWKSLSAHTHTAAALCCSIIRKISKLHWQGAFTPFVPPPPQIGGRSYRSSWGGNQGEGAATSTSIGNSYTHTHRVEPPFSSWRESVGRRWPLSRPRPPYYSFLFLSPLSSLDHDTQGGGLLPGNQHKVPLYQILQYEIQISRAGKKKMLCAKIRPIQIKMCLNENFKIEARLGRVHASHDGDVSRAGAQRKKKRFFFFI